MLARSFRLVTARLIPGGFRPKQAPLALLGLILAGSILAGCGGSSAPQASWRTVELGSYRFQVPAGWKATVAKDRYEAREDGSFVQAQAFPLVRAYRPSLFGKVEPELALRMAAVAKRVGGAVGARHTVSPGGIKSHAYDLKVGGRTDTYTFVLRDRHELQLICSADASVCDHLIASFAAT
jgi:hypothetical protein